MLLRLFSLQLNNDIHATCDNKSYVTKMNEFISYPYTKLFIHKIKESEAYLAILSCLPTNFVITDIKRHQDKQKSYQDLTIAEKINEGSCRCHRNFMCNKVIKYPSSIRTFRNLCQRGIYTPITPQKNKRSQFRRRSTTLSKSKIWVELPYHQ